MLLDLTKEYLSEMGIKILGDVIAILKHAKEVHSQLAREKVLKGSSRTASPVPTPRRSTAASRTVNHYLGSDPDAAPMNLPVVPKISKELSARLGEAPSQEKPTSKLIKLNPNKLEEVVPVPKSRRVFPEHEGRYKITMPAGTTDKTKKILEQQGLKKSASSSVFDRLGAEKSSSPSTSSSVFNRLGGTSIKRAATSTSLDLDSDEEEDSPLEYAGVLKNSPSPAKKSKPSSLPKSASLGKITITNVFAARSKVTTIKKGQPAKQKASGDSAVTKAKKSDLSGVKFTITNNMASKKALGLKKKAAPVIVSPPVKSAGVLSMDQPDLKVSARQRLGKKTALGVVSSTTGDDEDSPVKKKSGLLGRLGPQKSEVSSTSTASSIKTKKLTLKKGKITSQTGQGVFSRLGKQVNT
ncbi:hypothetical protein FSP39_020123 [Pinctada imbricata]|uniref:DUF5577 domain-containing protein n=1 Tax=Pinctada imbricata TaxID=66713 RepID=A0AA88XXE8_PINIB|nr:hypothetical protein FSP39_020123 [Pinctada imbricata]